MTNMHERKYALNWLESKDLRPTKQRLALAELLVGDGKNRHVTAESLYEEAQNRSMRVSLATVYNTLHAFVDAGLLNEVIVDGARSYFDTRLDQHPHYYWESEKRLSDAPLDAIKLSHAIAPEGTSVSRVDVLIRLTEKS